MKIKATKTGRTYAVINKRAARALAGMYPLPPEGGSITVAISPRDRSTLKLANDKGEWLLETFNKTVAEWPQFFGVTIEQEKQKYTVRLFDGHGSDFDTAATKKGAWDIMRAFIKEKRYTHTEKMGFKKHILSDGMQLEHAVYQTVYARIEE